MRVTRRQLRRLLLQEMKAPWASSEAEKWGERARAINDPDIQQGLIELDDHPDHEVSARELALSLGSREGDTPLPFDFANTAIEEFNEWTLDDIIVHSRFLIEDYIRYPGAPGRYLYTPQSGKSWVGRCLIPYEDFSRERRVEHDEFMISNPLPYKNQTTRRIFGFDGRYDNIREIPDDLLDPYLKYIIDYTIAGNSYALVTDWDLIKFYMTSRFASCHPEELKDIIYVAEKIKKGIEEYIKKDRHRHPAGFYPELPQPADPKKATQYKGVERKLSKAEYDKLIKEIYIKPDLDWGSGLPPYNSLMPVTKDEYDYIKYLYEDEPEVAMQLAVSVGLVPKLAVTGGRGTGELDWNDAIDKLILDDPSYHDNIERDSSIDHRVKKFRDELKHHLSPDPSGRGHHDHYDPSAYSALGDNYVDQIRNYHKDPRDHLGVPINEVITRRQLRKLIIESINEHDPIIDIIMSGEVAMGVELLRMSDPDNADTTLANLFDELKKEIEELEMNIIAPELAPLPAGLSLLDALEKSTKLTNIFQQLQKEIGI